MRTRPIASAMVVAGLSLGLWSAAVAGGEPAKPVPAAPATPTPAAARPAEATDDSARSVGAKLSDIIDPVVIQGVSAKRVFEWWSRTSGIALMIDWEAMAKEGIDPDQVVNLELRHAPAGQLLGILMKQVEGKDKGQALLYQSTPWYLEIVTKAQANKQCVLRLYDVRDLMHEPANFPPPPDFDLNTALSTSTSRGGGGGGSSASLFQQNAAAAKAPPKSEAERGEELANLIRDTIEPDIWIERGGQYASIKYLHGRLIVNAPLYVHAQIGISEPPVSALPAPAPRDSSSAGPVGGSDGRTPGRSNGVGAVQSTPSAPVAGKGK